MTTWHDLWLWRRRKRRNYMLIHGLLRYVIEGSSSQPRRSPKASGQVRKPQYLMQRKDLLPLLLPVLPPDNITPMVWGWHPSWMDHLADWWGLLPWGMELTIQGRGRASWGCTTLTIGWNTPLKYWITIPTTTKLYFWRVWHQIISQTELEP